MSESQKRKVLFVIDNLSTGGAQRQLVNLAVGMQRRNYEIAFFCYAQGDLLARPLQDAGIPVHWTFKKSRFSTEVIFALRDLMKSGGFELALSFLTTPNFYNILAGRLLTGHKIPVVVSERFCDLPGLVPKMELFAREFYRFASHVTTNSQHQYNNLAKMYPYLKKRLSRIYNGYDLDVFTPIPGEPENDPLRLLTISSVSPYKNGLCLVEALKILREDYHLEPQVSWIGKRYESGVNHDYAQQMGQKIEAYGLQNQWHWLGQRTDIVDQLHQHDVLVHPSYGEGMPNVVCEAMACARPVIVTNTLDHNNIVQEGKSGMLFHWDNPAELAGKIAQMAHMSPANRHQMGQCGRAYAEQNLTLERFVDDYDKLFQSLMR